MHFVGITRFNLVTSATLGHFNSTNNLSLEDAKRRIFDHDRLQAKLTTFEHFCLPTYRAFSSRTERSHGLVLISHDLPEPFRHRLHELCGPVPRLRVVEFQDEDTLSGRIDPILTDIAGTERVFNYRYDDDDVLAADFLNRVEAVCRDASAGTLVSMNRGFVAARLDDDSFGLVEQQAPLNAYGLGLVVDGAQPRNIFDLGRHDKVTDPVIHETDTLSWIAFRHGLNDSQSNVTELKRLKLLGRNAQPAAKIVEVLGASFPHLDPAALESLPVLNVQDTLEAIARRAIRRTRVLETALASERKKNHRITESATQSGTTPPALGRALTDLRTTRAALTRTRRELKDIKGSHSFRLARAIATTRSMTGVVSLPRRVWAACRSQV